jgi:hypothetical protein
MDSAAYQREVARLSNEVTNISSDIVSSDSSAKPAGKLAGIMKYKNYALIAGAVLLFLFIVKPKIVLKITLVDNVPSMVLDTKKFILWWICITMLVSLILFTYLKFRKLPG